MAKNRFIIAGAALAVIFGAANLAQAWDGGAEHHGMRTHRLVEHGYDQLPIQTRLIAFNEHGGAHETAPGNAAIHKQEMQGGNHNTPENVQKDIPYNQHGGGHETAPDNAAVHAKEMKDPNHKDLDV